MFTGQNTCYWSEKMFITGNLWLKKLVFREKIDRKGIVGTIHGEKNKVAMAIEISGGNNYGKNRCKVWSV